MLAFAQYRVEQRPVASLVKRFADRPLAFDEEGLLAFADRQPLAVGLVHQATAFALDALQVDILIVAHDHGHAPGQLAVVAGDHSRHTRQGHARGLVLGRADLHEIPQRGHAQWQVRVIGQQALAATATLRGDGPVVRGGDAEHVLFGDLRGCAGNRLQAWQLALEVEAGEFFRLGEGQRFVRVDRQQPGQLVGTHLLGHGQRGDLFLHVHRQTEVEQAEQQHRVLGLPVLGTVAGLGQIHRHTIAVAEHIGVDATRIDLEEALQAWRGVGVENFCILFQVDRAHEAVHFQHAGPRHLGQAALSQQAHADHLAETVTGMHVAQGKQRVVKIARFDQRHAECVTPHRRTLGHALDALNATGRRHAVGITAVEQGLAAGEANQ